MPRHVIPAEAGIQGWWGKRGHQQPINIRVLIMFNLSQEEITYEKFREFMEACSPEGKLVEYKRELPSKENNDDIAKQISAFANTDGGLIIYGIDTDKFDKPNWPSAGMTLEKGMTQKITHVGLMNIDPPYPPPIIKPIELPGEKNKGFIVVRVFESDTTPHAIKNGEEFYYRINANSIPIKAITGDRDFNKRINVKEIEYLFNKRAKAIAQRERLVDSARTRFNLANPDLGDYDIHFEVTFIPVFPTTV
ncbi:helix-turn-helix domain-containing protein, partial [Candidatus Zixiibacteriota bacterium]